MSAYTASLFELEPAPGPVRQAPPQIAPYAKGSDTSRAAAVAVTPKLPRRERAMLDYLRFRGGEGATDAELSDHFADAPFHWARNGTPARRNRLAELGLIVKTGERRRTGTGSPAAVWKAKE